MQYKEARESTESDSDLTTIRLGLIWENLLQKKWTTCTWQISAELEAVRKRKPEML